MAEMTLGDLLSGIRGVELRRGAADTSITDISRDSRAVSPGSLFVAIRGHESDGHDYLQAAVNAGASAVVVDADADCSVGVPVVEAKDSRAVLGPISSRFFGHPSRTLDVVGITGTNGKTSTSHLLESVFRRAGRAVGIIGTVEYRWPGGRMEAANTTPDGLTLQRTLRKMADDGVEVVVIEVSSHGLEHRRVDGTEFAVGVFTNLTADHVEFHGSFDAYRRAKWRLFDEVLPASSRDAVAVVNVDRSEGRQLLEEVDARGQLETVGFGLSVGDWSRVRRLYSARIADQNLEGIAIDVDDPDGGTHRLELGLPGRFNAENAVAAATTANVLGVEFDDIAAGLRQSTGIPGRMQRVMGGDDDPVVFVDYAHTADALEKALQTLRPLVDGDLWVVFGCGGDRDVSKREPMGAIAGRLADRAVVTSDNPRSEPPEKIIDQIAVGLCSLAHPEAWSRQVDRRKAILEAVLRAGSEDVVLIAGKGHETYQEQAGERRDFDDREVAADALDQRGESSCLS